jgi:hypothetical protein
VRCPGLRTLQKQQKYFWQLACLCPRMPHTLQIMFSNAGSECGGSEYNRSSGVDRAGVRGVSGDPCREDGSDLIKVVHQEKGYLPFWHL